MKRIYVAGPLTSGNGNPWQYLSDAIAVADSLLDLGYSPYVPHFTVFFDYVTKRPHSDWMEVDLDWLVVCDALVYLPHDAESGAATEVEQARKRGIPVYGFNELRLLDQDLRGVEA